MVDLRALVRSIPDYPKPGIMFRDITTLIEDAAGFRQTITDLAAQYRTAELTHVAGIEARGFIFGAALAIELGVGFIPVRKKGKLPGNTIGQNYALEYGADTIEIHDDVLNADHRVVVCDDLIATGGTAVAAIQLLRRTGAQVGDACFVIDLFDLGGAERLRQLDVDVFKLIDFAGH